MSDARVPPPFDPQRGHGPCEDLERCDWKTRCRSLAESLVTADRELASVRSTYERDTSDLTQRVKTLEEKFSSKELEVKLLKVGLRLEQGKNTSLQEQLDEVLTSGGDPGPQRDQEEQQRSSMQRGQGQLQLQFSICRDQVSAALQELENIRVLRKQLEKAQRSQDKLRRELEELQVQLDQDQLLRSSIQKELEEIQVQLDQEKLQRSSIQKEHEELQVQLDQEKLQRSSIQKELDQEKLLRSSIQKEHEELQVQLDQEKLQRSSIQKEQEELQVQLEILRNQELQAELDQVRLELESEDQLEESIQEEPSPPVDLDSSVVDSEDQRPPSFWTRFRRFLRRI
ncbi:uncharacterized protein V6R79_010619 [Siganus canaliculatus]